MSVLRWAAGKVLAMRDISVQESELLPIILQPLISSALQAAAGKTQQESQEAGSAAQYSSSSADRTNEIESIRRTAPAVEKLRVRCYIGPDESVRLNFAMRWACMHDQTNATHATCSAGISALAASSFGLG